MTAPLDHTPLDRMCLDALALSPARPAIEWGDGWVSWGALHGLADRVNALLARSGVHYEAPVVFVPRSRPSAVAALLGMLASQRTVRMIYPFQSPASLAAELAALEPAVVVAAAEDFAPEVRESLRAAGAAAIALRELDAQPVPRLEWTRRYGPSGAPPRPEIEILTSGTTGRPKRFGLTHELIARHIVAANKNYRAADTDYLSQPPMYLYYPLGNISGISGVLPTLLRGHRAVLVERFSVESWRRYICARPGGRAGGDRSAHRPRLDPHLRSRGDR